MAHPCHYDEDVTGEQLSPADHDEDKAEAEGKSGQKPHDPVGKPRGQCASISRGDRRAACGDRGRKDGSKGDECPAEHGEHQESQRIKRRAVDTALLGTNRHRGRHDGVEHDDLRRLRRCQAWGALIHDLVRQPPPAAPPTARSPRICTAMTFTIVMDGKIMA